MSQLQVSLGYGKIGIIELDTFTRILNDQIYDTEEIRKDFNGNYEYVAIALSGSNVDDSVWNCVRVTWLNGHRIRVQFQSNISWTTKDLNWPI